MDVRKLIPWAVCVVLVMLTAVLLLIVALKQPETISIETLEDEIKDGQITAIAIADEVLRVERTDGSRAVVNKEQVGRLVEQDRATHSPDTRSNRHEPGIALFPHAWIAEAIDIKIARRASTLRAGRQFPPRNQILRASRDALHFWEDAGVNDRGHGIIVD